MSQQSHMIRPSWYPAVTYLGDQKQELVQNFTIVGCIVGCLIILGCIFYCLLKRRLQMQAAHAALASPSPRGLDRQQIEMFEVSPYVPATGIATELEECPICQEQYEPGELRRILTCGHYYHMECVDVWLSSRRTCPECRREYL
ncbi:RING-H2 finger protein ATL10-like [Asparagus officinalis]|uniref:RING-H2 finger protein ATL10-like n=1 Tax=Asparagus officinalis TaxID=4686 RepID=UPI00098E3BAD|nr:RING-H2 finger protein ATL10-like [Asparagus officinalis]